ncbi:MAG: hypothetical protein KC731_41475 [Myxococcales bacterium]|nr:hypothetical protein [Myxococcales bacterium]
MPSPRLRRVPALRFAGAVGALVAASSCGGIGPGDYIVYRIAFQESQLSEDCFAPAMIPVDEKDDSSSLFTSGTFILYVGADDTPYLDLGATTLAGTDTGGGAYQFSGDALDVSYQGDMQEIRLENRTSIVVDLTVDGDLIDGQVSETQQQSCSGATCPDPPSSSCTQVTPFVGGRVEDVQLNHEV